MSRGGSVSRRYAEVTSRPRRCGSSDTGLRRRALAGVIWLKLSQSESGKRPASKERSTKGGVAASASPPSSRSKRSLHSACTCTSGSHTSSSRRPVCSAYARAEHMARSLLARPCIGRTAT
eukprot:scaffold69046_cov77-Phaeocystis_antarctica.AAC.6